MSNTRMLMVDEAEAEIISFEMAKTVVMGTPSQVDAEMEARYMEDTSDLISWDTACKLVTKDSRYHISHDGMDGFLVGIIVLPEGGHCYLVI